MCDLARPTESIVTKSVALGEGRGDVFQRHVGAEFEAGRPCQSKAQIGGLDHRRRAEDDRSLDRVAQFPQIARPRLGVNGCLALGREGEVLPPLPPLEETEIVPGHWQHVLLAVA